MCCEHPFSCSFTRWDPSWAELLLCMISSHPSVDQPDPLTPELFHSLRSFSNRNNPVPLKRNQRKHKTMSWNQLLRNRQGLIKKTPLGCGTQLRCLCCLLCGSCQDRFSSDGVTHSSSSLTPTLPEMSLFPLFLRSSSLSLHTKQMFKGAGQLRGVRGRHFPGTTLVVPVFFFFFLPDEDGGLGLPQGDVGVVWKIETHGEKHNYSNCYAMVIQVFRKGEVQSPP